jgi:hypothetical protein
MSRVPALTKGEKIAEGMAAAQEVGECLEWPGPFGNGRKKNVAIVKARSEKGRTDNYAVARELWEAAYGPIPEGQMVYRTCCNNNCVLLTHLCIGDRAAWAKARKKAGATKHHHSTVLKITIARRRSAVNSEEKAEAVRMLSAEGLRLDDIVEQTGVSRAMVEDIRSGKSWRRLSSPFAGLGARA